MSRTLHLTVDADGGRLDRFVAERHPELSRSRVQRLGLGLQVAGLRRRDGQGDDLAGADRGRRLGGRSVQSYGTGGDETLDSGPGQLRVSLGDEPVQSTTVGVDCET